MRISAIALAAAIFAFAGVMVKVALSQETPNVARGNYLVMSVAKCDDCHGDHLQGRTLDFLKPGLPMAYMAPKIAGLTQFSTQEAVTYLKTGKFPSGKMTRPPMPQYRFNNDGAVAIVAYLKSLK